jgi:pantetheine-phosphate adenylyltransferase
MTFQKRLAIYPGTFDGLTCGHIDIIKRASILFDRLIVSVACRPQKDLCFSVEERIGHLKKATADIKNVEIMEFDGLTVKFARDIRARFIIRGLRAISDFEYEIQLALLNRQMDPEIETIFLAPSKDYIFLSSSLIKDVILHNGSAKNLVPDYVEADLKKKLLNQGEIKCE